MTSILLRGLDIFTIVIPPALPIALSAGIAFSVTRLKKKEIICVQPSLINSAGRINLMCFDKTFSLPQKTFFKILFTFLKSSSHRQRHSHN